MRSMTGFGRADIEKDGVRICVEIKSVNHRYLDINIRSPRSMLYLEEEIRAILKSKFSRGRIEVFVNRQQDEETKRRVRINTSLITEYMEAAREVADIACIDDELPLSELLRLPDILIVEEPEQDEELLREVSLSAVESASNALIESRSLEGGRIVIDISARSDLLKLILSGIEIRAPMVVEEYKHRLKERVKELSENFIEESRIDVELLFFAEKSCITEEIVRIRSHLSQLDELIDDSETASGRALDFLMQELNREFNTIGSKASDQAITKAVLRAKGEVEKLREQIQNIE